MNKPTIAGTVPDNGPLTSEMRKIHSYIHRSIWFFSMLKIQRKTIWA